MNKRQLIFLFAILLLFQNISYTQELSKQVTAYVNIQDSIVAIKNVTVIDGTGGAIMYKQDVLFRNNKFSEEPKNEIFNYKMIF